jgi:hypothetical protein
VIQKSLEDIVAISHVVGIGGGVHKALTRRIVATYIQHPTNTIDERKIHVPPIAKFLELFDVVPSVDIVRLDPVGPFEEADHPLQFASVCVVAGTNPLWKLAEIYLRVQRIPAIIRGTSPKEVIQLAVHANPDTLEEHRA